MLNVSHNTECECNGSRDVQLKFMIELKEWEKSEFYVFKTFLPSSCSGSEEPWDRHPAEEDRRGAEPGRADPVPEEVHRALQPRWKRLHVLQPWRNDCACLWTNMLNLCSESFCSFCHAQRDEAVLHSVQHVRRQEGLSGEGGEWTAGSC